MTTPARIKLPLPSVRAVKDDGSFEYNWYRVMVQFFRLSGNSRITLADGVYLIETSPNKIDAFSTSDDHLIGELALKNIPGPTPIPIDPGAVSGFVYSPDTDGTLTVFGARVELERDNGGFQPLSLVGGSFPMLVNDTARIIWYGATPPVVLFWGIA